MFTGILSISIWVTALISIIDAINLQDQFVQNNTTSSYLNETVLCVKDVLIPQEIKETGSQVDERRPTTNTSPKHL